MKINKTLLVTILMIVLIVGVAFVSFEAGVRYANMQARSIRSEFYSNRDEQTETDASTPSPVAPRQGGNGAMIRRFLGMGR